MRSDPILQPEITFKCPVATPIPIAEVKPNAPFDSTAWDFVNKSKLEFAIKLESEITFKEETTFIPCQINITDPTLDLEIWIKFGEPYTHTLEYAAVNIYSCCYYY